MSNRSNCFTKNDLENSHHGKRYMAKTTLSLFVLGSALMTSVVICDVNPTHDANGVYDIHINEFKIDHLKKLIWNIIKESEEHINKAIHLKLWKVELPRNDKQLDKLNEMFRKGEDIKNQLGKDMDQGDAYKEWFPSDYQPPQKTTHIIVQPPLPGKRKAKDSDLDETNISKKEKLLDLSSPESIVRFFTEDDENKKLIKTDFAKPYKLCNNKFKFKREGRDDALYQAYDYIYERHCKISDAESLGDKELHPLLALQSAPGGGKSFFFDELASLKSEDINRYLRKKHSERINDEKFEEVINIIRNSISICITYNGGSSYDGNMDGDIRKGLIMRILWSYFFDENKLTWSSFCDKFVKHFDSLSTYMAIGSIIHHSGKAVLLCIDETMRVLPKGHSDLKNIRILLDELYKPYRDFSKSANKFYFVISTLDTLNVWSTQTDSQRPICWIPLRRLILSESANLFCTLAKNLDEHRLFVIKKCIADCNGHPRTLESFYKILDVKDGVDTALSIDVYSSLIERLAKDLGQLLGRISLPIVKIALLGNEKSITYEIETKTGKSSLRDLISSGIFINSLTSKEEVFGVIPTLSPVALQYFCIFNINNTNKDIRTIAKILRRLLTTESSFDDEVMDGKPFEKFHANWELLYRALRENGEIVSLHNIYGLSEEKIFIQLQRKEIAYCHNEIEFPPDDKIYDSCKKTFKNLVDYVFVPKKSNNSGFDMVIFERKTNGGGYIAINIECRFSYPNKKTTLGSKEISDKYENMKSKYLMHVRFLRNKLRTRTDSWENGIYYGKSAIGELQMKESDIYLVFVIWRDVVENLGNDILNNENIIIVKRDNLEKIYTPSLVSRPQFYNEILEQINSIRYDSD